MKILDEILSIKLGDLDITFIEVSFLWCDWWAVISDSDDSLGPLLLTWINFNPSMDK